MAVQSGFTKDDVSMTFTGSITSEDSGAGFGPGGGTFDVRWNATDKRLEKSADGGATWTTVLEFAAYDA